MCEFLSVGLYEFEGMIKEVAVSNHRETKLLLMSITSDSSQDVCFAIWQSRRRMMRNRME